MRGDSKKKIMNEIQKKEKFCWMTTEEGEGERLYMTVCTTRKFCCYVVVIETVSGESSQLKGEKFKAGLDRQAFFSFQLVFASPFTTHDTTAVFFLSFSRSVILLSKAHKNRYHDEHTDHFTII